MHKKDNEKQALTGMISYHINIYMGHMSRELQIKEKLLFFYDLYYLYRHMADWLGHLLSNHETQV